MEYRPFLKDWFSSRAGRPSMRGFARDVGCSPALISSVIQGRRNLTDDMGGVFAERMRLEEKETEFFLLLLQFDRATTSGAKQRAWEKIAASQNFQKARHIGAEQYEILSNWYHMAIVELCRCKDFQEDPGWISSTLRPGITSTQARESIQLLLDLRFLIRAPDGRLCPAEVIFADSEEPSNMELQLRALAVYEFNQWVLGRSQEAIDEFHRDERQFGANVLSLPESLLPEIKREIQQFQHRIIHLCENAPSTPDRVFQLSVQFFPLSERTST